MKSKISKITSDKKILNLLSFNHKTYNKINMQQQCSQLIILKKLKKIYNILKKYKDFKQLKHKKQIL